MRSRRPIASQPEKRVSNPIKNRNSVVFEPFPAFGALLNVVFSHRVSPQSMSLEREPFLLAVSFVSSFEDPT